MHTVCTGPFERGGAGRSPCRGRRSWLTPIYAARHGDRGLRARVTRRARRSVEVRREEILSTTVELLDRLGLASTRVADVAVALDVSPALVFYHFGTKDDLVAEAFAHAVERDLRRLEKAASGTDPARMMNGSRKLSNCAASTR